MIGSVAGGLSVYVSVECVSFVVYFLGGADSYQNLSEFTRIYQNLSESIRIYQTLGFAKILSHESDRF